MESPTLGNLALSWKWHEIQAAEEHSAADN
jgi:hypothetical protein